MPDISILDSSAVAVPKAYTIAGSQEIILKGVTASFDGTGAGGSFVPAVQVVDPSGHIVGTYTAGSTLTAGASADVSWFPAVGGGTGTSGSSSRSVPLYLDTPDARSNGIPAATFRNGYSNVRRVVPSYLNGVDGSWDGGLIVPPDYSSTPTVTAFFTANATTGVCRTNVSTSVVTVGSSEDPVYTAEAFVNTTVPGTANLLFAITTSLSVSPGQGQMLNVRYARNGTSGSDTLAVTLLLIACQFGYHS